jgi:hypothetical protein
MFPNTLRQGPVSSANPQGAGHDPQNLERLVFSEEFVGANAAPHIEASGRLPGIYNYFLGKDPKKWVTHVAAYSGVIYRDLWRGIDLRFYRNGADIEQEFEVRPGVDLTSVQVAYNGIEGLKIAKDGTLVIKTAFGELRETKPQIYQEIAGQRVPVEGRFKLITEFAYTFDVKSYQSQYALVIDPTLLYCTYLNGPEYQQIDSGSAIAVDSSGNAYVVGRTGSWIGYFDFPTTSGALETSPTSGSGCTFISKLNASGSALVYSTCLGGSGDVGQAITVDSSGNAYVTGVTSSSDFPTTPGVFQTTFAGTARGASNAFVTKLNPSGSALVYSTYLGGSGGGSLCTDGGSGIAIDSSGDAYVTGWTCSTDFPTTPGAFQTTFPGSAAYGATRAFVTELNPSGSALVYSTYLGGSTPFADRASGIAVDSLGNAYVTGNATSADFPTTAGAFQNFRPSGNSTFVTKVNATGSALVYSTYLGGSGCSWLGDSASGIAVDSSGNAYVTGGAYSIDFPTTPGAFQASHGGPKGCYSSAYITKMNPGGSELVYSTYLGAGNEAGAGIALDSVGNANVTGYTGSCNFPVTSDAIQASCGGSTDAFFSRLSPEGNGAADLLYSTYLGGSSPDYGYGIAVDATGSAYLTGETYSNFPVTQGAFQTTIYAYAAAFIAKFGFQLSGPSIVWIMPNVGGNAGTITPTIVGSGFLPGATMELDCPGLPSIVGTNTTVSGDGTRITATFNLVGVAPDTCNVVVTDPNGATVSQQQAFTVEQGGAADLWVDIVGFDELEAGEPQQYYIVYGNRGNLDPKIGVGLWVSFPSFITCTTPQNEPVGGSLQLGSNTVLFFQLASSFPAGEVLTIPMSLTAPALPQYRHYPFQIQTWFGPP